jgi:mono/diheme cytochrome c family protein
MMNVRALAFAAAVSVVLVSTAMAQTPDSSAATQPPAAAPAPTATGDAAAGETTFKGRCAGCHETGAGGAPDKSILKVLSPSVIFDVLKTGPMMAMASGLGDDDMHNIAAYLTAPAKPAA